MKQLFNKLFFIAIAGLMFAACKKDIAQVFYSGGTASVLTASLPTTDTIPLAVADTAVMPILFTWTNPNYTFSNGISPFTVSYDIQMDTLGANFANANKGKGSTITISPNLQDAPTEEAINNALVSVTGLGLTPGKTYTIQVRIKSYLPNGTTIGALALYSDTLTYVVTPFAAGYPTLWVPGDYEGWAPASAPNLVLSPFNTTAYEGYINVASGGTYQFKITSSADFNHTNYGDGGNDAGNATTGGGDLSTNGGAGNLTLPGGGYYLLTADVTALTWTYTNTVWGVIGSFAASNWSSDIPMTYDPIRQELYSVITFAANDQFKFRANGSYAINFGLNASNNMVYNGSNNFTVPTAGVDTVFLDLHTAGNYKYSVVPQ